MKPLAAVALLCLILGISAPVQAQTGLGSGLGPVYLTSVYGIKSDGSNDDTSAFQALLNLVANAYTTCSPNCGGTIQLAVTGHKTKISTGHLIIPPNVNIVGCGTEGHDVPDGIATAPCGLDLQYGSDPYAKVYLQSKGQNYFHDLAIVDTSNDCSTFFYVTQSVVHFQNVSIKGTQSALTGTPCNDGFILGGNYWNPIHIGEDGCTSYTVPGCFQGYGSTFQNIWFSNTKRFFQLGTASNGSDFNYIFGDATNGYLAGEGAAIEINASNVSATHQGSFPYGNVFGNLHIEQGAAGGSRHYNYGLTDRGGTS
jgi:hypothetical protein